MLDGGTIWTVFYIYTAKAAFIAISMVSRRTITILNPQEVIVAVV